MILPITLTIAAAAAIINIWLAIRIGQLRGALKISIGDGGDNRLIARMRAQSNFIEFTPIVLILIGLIELANGTMTWLWGVGILYTLSRIAHAIGMDRPAPNPFRMVGAIITIFTTLGLAGYALSIPYVTRNDAITTVGSDSLATPPANAHQ